MKLLITTLAGTALLALSACNQADAGNNSGDNATEAEANEAAPDANAADANAAKPEESNEVTPPAADAGGDKPVEVPAADDAPADGNKSE